MAKTAQQPFFLMANSHDPHDPFAGSSDEQGLVGSPHFECADPSRVFRPEEVKVPGFLPDLPGIRRELAAYCSSVRRLDDTVGAVLRALDEAGLVENTIVMFLSDNGIGFHSAKMNCYVDSTRTPWIVRWPGRIEKGVVDRTHMISTVDLQPTLLEAVGLPPQTPADGRSFLPLLEGEPQSGREYVFTQFNHIHGERPCPIRAVMSTRSLYIFNPWSNGKRRFVRELIGVKDMRAVAKEDTRLARRLKHLEYRTVEEFYDLRTDPYCLDNLLAKHPSATKRTDEHDQQIALLRGKLREWLRDVSDPALTALDNRHDPEALEKYMREYAQRAKKEIEALIPYEKAQRYRF